VAGDHGETVIVLHIHVFPINFRDPFHRVLSFRGDNRLSEDILHIFIDGALGDFFREIPHNALQKIVVIQNQSLSIQVAKPLKIIDLRPDREIRAALNPLLH